MRRGLLRSDGGGATPLDEREVGPSARLPPPLPRAGLRAGRNLMGRYLRAGQGF
ncbi:hypothetical protein [Streptomyces decoyicus]|uniref:hypothetical protein n=1 Tax=Streptomyces decoyicus TaxID=249567 RepID=UPI003867B654